MGRPEEGYHSIIVETYYESGSGLHGDVHVRPIAGQMFSQSLRVRGFRKKIRDAHPVGTQFRVQVKLTDKEGSTPFLHMHHNWDHEVIK